MGSDLFQSQNKIICALCKKSDETEITGPLSSKGSISAHQNCLLYASGIYCKNSPTYDDLFGFEVEDVKKELRRGRRLPCYRCKKNGATAGCDVKRCKRSYHYPCAIEDHARIYEDRFILFCKLHDPESKKTSSAECERPDLKRPERRDSDASTGSSEVSLSKKKRTSPIFIDSDIEMYGPVESDTEDCTPPNHNNHSTPDPESKRPCAGPSPSTTGSLKLTSAQKACGSADHPEELHSRSTPYPCMYRACMNRSSEVETPRRKKVKRILDSVDEGLISTDHEVAPAVSGPEDSMLLKQPNHSTPVPKKTRPCEKPNSSTTEADDDTDIDSEDSQSLLSSKTYCITVPCTVIMDSGLSAESEQSLEHSSPASAAPAAMCISPGSVTAPEHKETPSTSRTSPPPRTAPTDPVSPDSIYSMPTLDYFFDGPSGQPGSPPHLSPTVEVPAVSTSAVQTLSASHFKSKRLRVLSPPAGVSSSPARPASADASDVSTKKSSESSAAIFWTRCNEARWTKEIFSDLLSQLSSLGERVQSQEASQQDYDVALKVLGASGWLPCIVSKLEQDLEKQEQDLQRKKAALRDAKAVLGV